VLCLILSPAITLAAQELTRGSLLVVVTDQSGAVVPGASVTAKSPQGEFTGTTSERGEVLFSNLVPGPCEVKASKTGFNVVKLSDVMIRLNERVTASVTLEVGLATQTVEVFGVSSGPDLSTTSTGANITSAMLENTPVQRNVTAPLYLSAGVTDGIGTGKANPSIAGASGLENLYLIDGVNNTNTGFGGFGTYSLIYGSVGTGVTTSFIQEIQVKTGGMEAQYGQALGGVVTMITKSGGNSFHGALFGYYTPRAASAAFEQANPLRTSDFLTEVHGRQEVDWGVEGGGPIFKDKIFWYGALNPVNTHTTRQSPPGPSFLGPGSLIADLGEHDQIKRTINYAGKLSYHLNQNHTFEGSIFGDPTIIGFGPNRTLVTSSFNGFSRLSFRSINWQGRYNGVFANWVVTASGGQNHNRFDEQQLQNEYAIQDRARFNTATGTLDDTLPLTVNRGGAGAFQNTNGGADKFINIDLAHTFSLAHFGQHQINFGYQYEDSSYNGTNVRTGPDWFLPSDPKIDPLFSGAEVFGASVRLLSCERQTGSPDCNGLVPASQLVNGEGFYYKQTRGNFKGAAFTTGVQYYAGYAQDNWQVTRRITLKAGLRWEQEKIGGNPTGFTNDCPVGFADLDGNVPLVTRSRCSYTFNDSWGPRVGAVVDPWGNRKGKAFFSFGRFFERIPQDLAQRSIVPETGYLNLVFFSDNDLVPRLDQAHYLQAVQNCNGSTGAICSTTGARIEAGPAISGGAPTVIAPGTKMQYQDEFLVGFEYELPKGFLVSARYQDRRIKRIVEDSAAFTAAQALQGGLQQFVIQNVSKSADNFNNVVTLTNPANPATDCQVGTFDSASLTCFTPDSGQFTGGDGIPDGFPNAVRNYQAVELGLERRFNKNWQLFSNFRIARLRGNFEGSFRNDNGQQDPNISSLFDFTASGADDPLADQFKVGPLPSDRRYTVNVYGSYLFNNGKFNGLNLGTGLRVQSGTPISEFDAHPVYDNAGELPVGGRGKLGRTPVVGTVDAHADYAIKLGERFKVRLLADVFNIGNAKRIVRVDQRAQLDGGTPNPDFLRPGAPGQGLPFTDPISSRFAIRFEW